jgi:negative regulator of flagellin synthesis FlgM
MSNDISGIKMTIDFRNIQSNQPDATSKQSATSTAPETKSQASESSSTPVKQDTVVLSNQAQVIQSVVAEISQPPSSNPERIEALRNAINSGEFTVSAESIASKMLSIDFGNRNQN